MMNHDPRRVASFIRVNCSCSYHYLQTEELNDIRKKREYFCPDCGDRTMTVDIWGRIHVYEPIENKHYVL